MFRTTVAFSLSVLLTACAASGTPKDGETAASTPDAPPVEVSPESSAVEVEPQPFAAIGSRPAETVSTLNSSDLEVWRDPAFQRQMAESLAAETDVEPKTSPEEKVQLLAVYERLGAKDLDGAAALLASRPESCSAALDFTLANIWFQQQKLTEAAGAYELATQKFPKFRRAWRNLGQIQFKEARYEEAAASFAEVVRLGGGDAGTYGLLGVAHSKAGSDLAAESAFRMASLMDPGNDDWKIGMAESFLKQRRYLEAINQFDQLIKAKPERSEFWMAQGEAFALTDQPLRAAENFEMVDRLGKSSVRSLNNLGDIYANQELHDLAVGAYLRALRLDPDGPVDRAIRAAKFMSRNNAMEESGQLVDGIREIRGATLTPAESKDLLHLRARIAGASGNDADSEKILEEIVGIDPLDGAALIQLGQLKARGGDSDRAVFFFERAANLESFEAEARLRHGELLVRDRKYQEAIPFLKKSLELRPQDSVQRFLEQVERAAATRGG